MTNSAPRNRSSVLAVIVSYNGEAKLRSLVHRLANQVDQVFVVDNGSCIQTLDLLRELKAKSLIELHEVGTNKGLAYAMNLGVERARALGFSWLLTMDQDSLPDEQMVPAMLSYVRENPEVKCLSPNLCPFSGEAGGLKSGPVPYAISSGNLVHLTLFSETGPYNEGLFIDCLDFEFCLRVRKSGHEIHKVSDATMFHEVGEKSNVPRVLEKFYTQHSPTRRYYSFRNLIYVARNHFWFDVRLVGVLICGQLLLLFMIIAFDNQKLMNLRYIFRGVRDGIAGKMGPCVEANT